ncbi:hypothetical protein A5742_04460 [Mycolicibacterium fortuitum]|uniref:Uncharacterized protein n=1 Tax=Mycolicibacterium fortuitum TaxID=1766 RepID=A0ABD6QJ35_MYCFO|nr:hypothetical protein A5742_04460 [Mycolicibacterium fortuitum]
MVAVRRVEWPEHFVSAVGATIARLVAQPFAPMATARSMTRRRPTLSGGGPGAGEFSVAPTLILSVESAVELRV